MKDQFYIYGHELTEKEIKRKHKYCLKKIKKNIYQNEQYTITFDVRMAYAYRLKGYKIVIWGGLYHDRLTFVFEHERIKYSDLPF